ncbi:hypothetical protein JCM18900_1430 [Psychrobacter sp. JCM 18900]|nr:hypothetical protein JCM18900_1430 [Psychrobacter sp. JCM 18900]
MKEVNGNIDEMTLIDNWQQVSKQMKQACDRADRQVDNIMLLAVSKTKPAI